MITHYDLFAGIGGFSIALEEVFDEPVRHIFCEWESFPTAVLRQHWPDGEFWGDIAELVAHTGGQRWDAGRSTVRPQSAEVGIKGQREDERSDFSIVTGGFPCQPFSHAGRRRGTADDRYQWPNMFAVIRNVKPEWVIAENVRGLVTWNEGMVLEQVCTDLESEGYEVQPFIIPAVAVNAPHRRDRVWIVAHAKSRRSIAGLGLERKSHSEATEQRSTNSHATDSTSDRQPRRGQATATQEGHGSQPSTAGQLEGGSKGSHTYPEWNRDWREVAFATCNDSVDDGLSRPVDGVPYTRAKWRKHSLKAYGNGIVPQVAIEIMKAIKEGINYDTPNLLTTTEEKTDV